MADGHRDRGDERSLCPLPCPCVVAAATWKRQRAWEQGGGRDLRASSLFSPPPSLACQMAENGKGRDGCVYVGQPGREQGGGTLCRGVHCGAVLASVPGAREASAGPGSGQAAPIFLEVPMSLRALLLSLVPPIRLCPHLASWRNLALSSGGRVSRQDFTATRVLSQRRRPPNTSPKLP